MKNLLGTCEISEKIQHFLDKRIETPFLVVDLDIVKKEYLHLRRVLPTAQIYYAMKANPAPEILNLLVKLGSKFDIASIYELQMCLAAGANPESISFGNTIKKACDISQAYSLGVKLFAFDSIAELEKIAAHAPGSSVICRILTDNTGAEWPLSKKFGCDIEMAYHLLLKAQQLKLEPYGVSFHVGSQQTDPQQWTTAIERVSFLFAALKSQGISLRAINLGGGFPAHYRTNIPGLDVYSEVILEAMNRYFENQPIIMIEPGRSLVADAGLIQTEIILISQKTLTDDVRWVYLDIGKFGGLIETMDEAIKYRIRTPYRYGSTGKVILAGPTCDSADILYEKATYQLPLGFQIGDRIEILSTGAYTSTYSSVCFNGFPPLKTYCI